MVGCLGESPDEGLRRSVATWLTRVLLPARIPGVRIPEVEDLQEIQAMLAERVLEWTREWKEEGRQEGRLEGRQEGRQEGIQEVVLSLLEQRFGTVSEETRRRVQDLRDLDDLKELAKKVLVASSLDELGLI